MGMKEDVEDDNETENEKEDPTTYVVISPTGSKFG